MFAVTSKLAVITEAFIDLSGNRKFRGLHSYQREIFEAIENNPRVCIVASRQIGKSETLVRFALAWAQAFDDQIILIVSAGERQASEILERIKLAIHDQKYPTPLVTENSTEIALKETRSRILSLPNSPNTVRGYPANLLLVDETDSIENWEKFVAALWPSVSRTNGKIVCSGTYQGKKQLYKLTQDPKWQTFIFPWTVNPPNDIERQRHDLPANTFAQEFECIAIDSTGTLFPFEQWDACVNDKIDLLDRRAAKTSLFFAGYDPAKLVDNSVVAILEVPESGKPRLRILENYRGMNYSTQAAEIKGLHNIFHFYSLHVDQTGAAGTFERCEDAVGSVAIGVTFTVNTKQQLINDFRIAVQDKEIELPDHPILRREAHDLDPNKLDHPSGGSSDYLWATCLAWHGYRPRNRNSTGNQEGNYAESSIDFDFS